MEALPPLNEAQRAEQEAANALLQYDRTLRLIEDTLRTPGPFRLRPHVIQELNRISIQRLEADAGRWRDVPMQIGGSKHTPPPAPEVPRLIDEMCEYVNDNWNTKSGLHLAAYVMWRLNWIHAFVDGNGRTTRAVSYFVLCCKVGFHTPGVRVIPDFITENKQPYYAALEAADDAYRNGNIDLSMMEEYLGSLLARQMVEALKRAHSGGPPTPRLIEAPQHSGRDPNLVRRDLQSVHQVPFSQRWGLLFAAVALGFFMILVLLSVAGYEVPRSAHFLIAIVLALSTGSAVGFLGENASARGSIPLPRAQQYPLAFAATGGIATFIIVLILGFLLIP